ncbi:MAG TPA: PEGA domain-containing protein [Desulfuromonadales bacterium]|nr:PEGA domain-containing protein [Desulfuromonadales bacterium]
MLRKILVVLLVSLFSAGCSSQAVFLSEPSGADVFVNGSKVGTTPFKYEYTLNAGGHYSVALKKKGYETVMYTMASDEINEEKRNMLLTAGTIIPGGSVLWVGALFTKGLKDTYEFTLKEQPQNYTALSKNQDRTY